jgi:hypothetical protein
MLALGAAFGLKQNGAPIIKEVVAAVKEWSKFAKEAGVPQERITQIWGEQLA